MMMVRWHGVFPAITTPFRSDGSVDLDLLTRHATWMVDAGCTGLIALGSLGEGGTLRSDEREAVLVALVKALGSRVPIVAAVASLSTADACDQAKRAKTAGCRGLMVLPPYVYRGDWRETRAHFEAVMNATDLGCMLYNNPIAYGTDVSAEQIAELADLCPTLQAVKESSGDVRRVTAIGNILSQRLAVFMGVDDLIVEGIAAGATGWVAGLVNAFPRESVRLFDLARAGEAAQAAAIYRWFLPLLRMDIVPEFVHLIKLAQCTVGWGNGLVRPPRLPLVGPRREQAMATIQAAMRTAPR